MTRLDHLPSALRRVARHETLAGVPALLAHPDPGGVARAPAVLWMHGRTAHKELDPGRYLRWIRAGIGVCAVDLPGHGERRDARLLEGEHTLEVVERMVDEIDGVVDAMVDAGPFDRRRLAIGGMSAGGMAALARLCRPHGFVAAAVEATSGSWSHQDERAMFRDVAAARVARLDPIRNLDGWREIPLLVIHSRGDRWMHWSGQAAFVEALRGRYENPERIEVVLYESTGAPHEHVGFGRMAADAKQRQRDFLARHLA